MPPVTSRLLAGAAVPLLLAACATANGTAGGMPPLRLAPAALGGPLALQQHITLRAPGHEQQMDALLEADPAHVRLAIVALGQVAARIDWDGRALAEWHAPWWPAAVPGARILDDLQFALWPLAAVQAALPARWQASDDGVQRVLAEDGTPVVVLRRTGPDALELDQRRAHYRLTIVSQAAASAPAGDAP